MFRSLFPVRKGAAAVSKTEVIDYDAVQRVAEQVRPRMLVVGASAYARTFDFPRF